MISQNGGGVACNALSPGTTFIRVKAGKVETLIPVTVKSSNLLAYGPASANGLTATVTDVGLLHVKGQTATAHKGLQWTLPDAVVEELRGRTVTLSNEFAAKGLYRFVHLVGENNKDLGNILATAPGMLVPQETQRAYLRVLTDSTSPVDSDIGLMLNFGDTPLPWTRPDDTSLEGGGYELTNLFPDMPSQTVKGINFERTGDRQWHITGASSEKYVQISQKLTLETGTYELQSTVVTTAESATAGQAQVQKPSSGWLTGSGKLTIEQPFETTCQITANDSNGNPVDTTVSDVSLVKLIE